MKTAGSKCFGLLHVLRVDARRTCPRQIRCIAAQSRHIHHSRSSTQSTRSSHKKIKKNYRPLSSFISFCSELSSFLLSLIVSHHHLPSQIALADRPNYAKGSNLAQSQSEADHDRRLDGKSLTQRTRRTEKKFRKPSFALGKSQLVRVKRSCVSCGSVIAFRSRSKVSSPKCGSIGVSPPPPHAKKC